MVMDSPPTLPPLAEATIRDTDSQAWEYFLLLARPLEVHGGKLSIKYFNDAPMKHFQTVLGGIFIMERQGFMTT